MTTIICDFMGDSSIEEAAAQLCLQEPHRFSHLFSHRRPKASSALRNLQFIDATYLYRQENLSKAFPQLAPKAISLEIASHFIECQSLFMTMLDRTLPSANSAHEKQTFFWDLVGYYLAFFEKNPEIDSIVYDNVPHLPWDICLFYVSKFLNHKVFVLRKTGLRGYIYIDEDFRPGRSKWNITYQGIENPLTSLLEQFDQSQVLNDLCFTKGQIGGSWPAAKKPSLFQMSLGWLRKIGLKTLVTTVRVLTVPPLNNQLGATEDSVQRTVFAGMAPLNKFGHFKLHMEYLRKLRECKSAYRASLSANPDYESSFVYLSLHYQPERTTMPEGLYFDDQILVIRLLAAALPSGWKLFVKEHPRQLNYDMRSMHARTAQDYERIRIIPNVELISEKTPQGFLIEKCKITATISGSVSWEGILKGKPSIVFSENWHAPCVSTRFVSNLEETKAAILELKDMTVGQVKEEAGKYIRSIKDSLVNGALNHNHLRMFFHEENREVSAKNIASALLQRLKTS